MFESIKIRKRDGRLVDCDTSKITNAVRRSIADVRGDVELDLPADFCLSVIMDAMRHNLTVDALDVEAIQDAVERKLLELGWRDVAKHYLTYRDERAAARKAVIHMVCSDGERRPVLREPLYSKLTWAMWAFSVEDSDKYANEIIDEVMKSIYDGISQVQLHETVVLCTKARIERNWRFDGVAARLIQSRIFNEVYFDGDRDESWDRQVFRARMTEGVEAKRINPVLLEFDLDRLADALVSERDFLLNTQGIQALYDRYFLHINGRRIETPQFFWMRVAMGLAINESDREGKAIEFYNVLSQLKAVCGTPTLFNSGTCHSQLSSCYLSTVQDDLTNIFKVVADNAQLSKWAGGIGNDWTNVRATNAVIKGTNGQSQGVIPFLKVVNDTCIAVNQCFDPKTLVFTQKGPVAIESVLPGDLVLGHSGTYREVEEVFEYDQEGPMVEVDVKHCIKPIKVTAGHPVWTISGVPMEQSISRTTKQVEKGRFVAEWKDAGDLVRGDYVAQTIPTEVVPDLSFKDEDFYFYGLMLGNGHQSGHEWGLSGNPQTQAAFLNFARDYLAASDIHFWETHRGDTYTQLHWSVGPNFDKFRFDYVDLYDEEGNKRIQPSFLHLPPCQTLEIIRGLLQTDGHVEQEKELTFYSASEALAEGFRYLCLRLEVPTAGNYALREHDHQATRSDGSVAVFNSVGHSYTVRIPAVEKIANLVGAKPLTKFNWFKHQGCLFTRVKSVTPVEASSVVFDLKVEGDETYTTNAFLVHNGGKRKGSACCYLETWHLDIEEFLDLRKNTGDDRRRTHDLHLANWIPDLFMQRVEAEGEWTLFSPDDVPDLHDLYGLAFKARYEEYEQKAANGEIKHFKKVGALELWRKMLTRLFETGHPWIVFKDPANVRSMQQHAGVIHSSNLCTEIFLNTSKDETAVCNLASINLKAHLDTVNGTPFLNGEEIKKTVKTIIRMLDNVIDINFYPTPEARNANTKHRPIGLGIMGFQDALTHCRFSYASQSAVKLADESMELIAYAATEASSDLAAERGVYGSYEGSRWSQGILPIDTIADLCEARGVEYLRPFALGQLNWKPLREKIAKQGMRNSYVMAIAPTATISLIAGCTQSIEAYYKNLYVKSNLSGEFTQVNESLIKELEALGLWDEQMLEELKYHDGVLTDVTRIPAEVKARYLTSFEIEPEWLIRCAAARQKWIDMGQSLNLYMKEPSGRKLHDMYMLAWKSGLKSTYYLRTLAATQVEKSTVDINKFGVQPKWMKSASASADIQVGRACNLDDPTCESCQ
jgi:ribonucleoside-diphosphate reductase alpha chain